MTFIYLSAAVLAVIFFLLLLQKFSRNIEFGLALYAFFLPFERIPTLEIGGSTLKINHIIGAVLMIVWFADRYVFRKTKPLKNPLAPIFLLLIGVFALAISNAVFPTRAIIASLQVVFTVFSAAMIYDLVRSPGVFFKLEKVIFFSAWFIVIVAFWQFVSNLAGLPLSWSGLLQGYSKEVFGFPRIQGFSKEPLYFGNYLFLPLGLVVGKLLRDKKLPRNLWFLGALILVAFLLTLSRGAILGLLFSAVLFFLWLGRSYLTKKNFAVGFGSLVIFITLVLLGVSAFGGSSVDRFLAHLSVKDFGTSESTVSRISSVKDAVSFWSRRPLLGIGPAQFGPARAGYDSTDPRFENIVNNEYFELLAETGLLGLGVFLTILVAIFRRSVAVWRFSQNGFAATSTALSIVFAGMLVQYNFFSTLPIIHIWFMIGFILAVQRLALKNDKIA